ncbi:MAG: hypothetical protein MK198_14855 [Gracilimonas sp.]|nr:hypothetical protein [Gracilimonas sp.]
MSNTMDAGWVADCLKTAVGYHGAPQIINSDQGTQFTGSAYIGYLKSLKTVQISIEWKRAGYNGL